MRKSPICRPASGIRTITAPIAPSWYALSQRHAGYTGGKYYDNASSAEQAMDAVDVYGVVVIPQDFAENENRTRSARRPK